jgi:hypothetical protein
MLRNKLAVIGMIIGMIAGSSFGFWVQRSNQPDTISSPSPTQGEFPITIGASNSNHSNYGVWVDLPQVDMGLSALQNSPSPLPNTMGQEKQSVPFTQFSDVSSDLEYESRSFNLMTYSGSKATIKADIIKISGRYEYFPNDNESYGFHFYNEHVSGFDYMSTFDAAGVYKRYFGNAEAGCTFNFNFQSGLDGGLIVGPTFHYLYKNYLGAIRYAGGGFGSYSYCNLKNFKGSGRHFFSYGLMGGGGMPITDKIGGNLETYISHEFFVGSLQFPYTLSKDIQFVGGVKKAFIFKESGLSNWVITIGASKRF